MTHQIFPNASDDATNVGVVMRRSLATMSFLAGLVIFLVRNETSRIAKRTLFGCSIGFAAIALSIIKEIVYNTALIPAPALAIYVLIACTSGYLALKK